MPNEDLVVLGALERKVLCISNWVIHNGIVLRDAGDSGKVGGHRASKVSLMTAAYFLFLRTAHRMIVRPHAGTVIHAVQLLLGYRSRKNLLDFGELEGAQTYPSRTRDGDGVDFSAGPARPGVGTTVFAIIAQDRVRACPGMQRASRSRYRFRAARRPGN